MASNRDPGCQGRAREVFYSSFLLRVRWNSDGSVLDGEIRRLPTAQDPNPRAQRFTGLDTARIVEFVRDNLETPGNGVSGRDARDF